MTAKKRKAGPTERAGRSKAAKTNFAGQIPDSDDRFDRIPLIAARFLKDNNFKEAAQRAYALFDACREQRDHRSISQLVAEARYVPFNDAVREITGLKDREHGPKEYREFCLHVLLPLWQAIQKADSECGSSADQDDLSADQYVDRFLEKQRDQGFLTC